MPRNFNGTTHSYVQTTDSAAVHGSVPMVAAAIVYNDTNGGVIICSTNAGGTNRRWYLATTSTKLGFGKGSADLVSSSLTITTGKWYLVGAYVTSTQVRFFAYDYAADTFTAENIADTHAFDNPTNTIILGVFQNGSGSNFSWFNGDMEIVGVWTDAALAPTDDQLHALAFDHSAWYEFANPAALWLLDQSAVAQLVNDEQGIAKQTATANTSVSTRSVPIWTPGVGPLLIDAGTFQTVTGAAALTGAGTLTAAGTHTAFAAAALAGTGSSTAAGVRTRLATSIITGTGSLAAAGVQTSSGASALAGLGSVTAAGAHTALAAADLVGLGTLTASGSDQLFGTATLAGAGSLAAAGVRIRFGVAAMPGAGSLAAAGALTAIGAAILEGIGSLVARGHLFGSEPPVTTVTRSGPASGRTDTETAPGTTRSSATSGRTRSTLGDN